MDRFLCSSEIALKLFQHSGNVITVDDLVLTPPRDLAKRCRVSIVEITQLIQTLCNNQGALAFTFSILGNSDPDESEQFSIGDSVLDSMFGGGLRTGMIWEIVGERYCYSFTHSTDHGGTHSLAVLLGKLNSHFSHHSMYSCLPLKEGLADPHVILRPQRSSRPQD